MMPAFKCSLVQYDSIPYEDHIDASSSFSLRIGLIREGVMTMTVTESTLPSLDA